LVDPLRNFDGHDIEVGLLGKNGHPLVETAGKVVDRFSRSVAAIAIAVKSLGRTAISRSQV